MDLFGVQELATSKSIATPGWAYVPDTLSSAALPASRKRARHTASAHDQTARQEAKIARDLAALEKEAGGRDVAIPVPVRQRDGAGRATHGKVTPAVRKILQSQKTFANHLSDAEALAALAPPTQSSHHPTTSTTSAAAAAAAATNTAATSTPQPSRRSHKRRSGVPPTTTTGTDTPTAVKPDPASAGADTTMPDAPPALLATAPRFAPHPGDNDPLLRSRVPPMPSQEEVEALMAAPALGYVEARARLDGGGGGGGADRAWRTRRRFCEVCGYWGRVRCVACGTRCCALECLGVHREECFGGGYGG